MRTRLGKNSIREAVSDQTSERSWRRLGTESETQAGFRRRSGRHAGILACRGQESYRPEGEKFTRRAEKTIVGIEGCPRPQRNANAKLVSNLNTAFCFSRDNVDEVCRDVLLSVRGLKCNSKEADD